MLMKGINSIPSLVRLTIMLEACMHGQLNGELLTRVAMLV
jgi:hypothetical protein